MIEVLTVYVHSQVLSSAPDYIENLVAFSIQFKQSLSKDNTTHLDHKPVVESSQGGGHRDNTPTAKSNSVSSRSNSSKIVFIKVNHSCS